MPETVLTGSCRLCPNDALERYVVAESGSFVVLTSDEPLTDGHLFIVPRDHVPCIADVPDDLKRELTRLKERIRQMLLAIVGQSAIIEFAGTGASGHACLQIVPMATDLLPALLAWPQATPIDGLEDLTRRVECLEGYVYWEEQAGAVVLPAALGQRVAEQLRERLAERPPRRTGASAASWIRDVSQRRMAAQGVPIPVVTSFICRDGLICLLRRSPQLDSAPGKWHGVSGYLPDGVEPTGHALREIEQETGLEPNQVSLAKAGRPRTFGSPAIGRLWLIYPFLFDLLEGEPRLNWEHVDLAWIQPSQIWQFDCVGSVPELLRELLEVGG